MELKLDSTAIKQLFEECATPALKSKIRETIKQELDKVVKEEVEKKINNFFEDDKMESIFKDVLRRDIFKNYFLYEKERPLDIMNKIVLEEFKKKVKNVNFNETEKIILKECRVIMDEKMNGYKKICKSIDRINLQ